MRRNRLIAAVVTAGQPEDRRIEVKAKPASGGVKRLPDLYLPVQAADRRSRGPCTTVPHQSAALVAAGWRRGSGKAPEQEFPLPKSADAQIILS